MNTIDNKVYNCGILVKTNKKTCQKSEAIFPKPIDTMTQMSPLHAIVIWRFRIALEVRRDQYR